MFAAAEWQRSSTCLFHHIYEKSTLELPVQSAMDTDAAAVAMETTPCGTVRNQTAELKSEHDEKFLNLFTEIVM